MTTAERVWDYGTEFNTLWALGEDVCGHAIVTWDDTPVDPTVGAVLTEPHLTPFDWAVTARCRKEALRVTIVDMRPSRGDGYAALRWWETLNPASAPWLRRITAEQLAEAEAAGDAAVVELLRPVEPDPAVRPSDVRAVLLSLPICSVDRSPVADHHAIANLIGPMLLDCCTRPRAPGAPDHRAAVHQILRTAGLLPTGQLTAEERTDARQLAAAGCRAFTNVLLVDDMADLGWAEFARSFWPIGLTARTAPDELVAALRNKAPPALNGRPFDLILLDLRLTNSVAATTQLAWELRDLIAQDSGLWELIVPPRNESDADNLTLLARLLANAFPDLPIVLFSTTLRRDIVERLRPFDNIITDFGKPRLAEGEQGALRALEGFGRALDAACAVKRADELVTTLVSAADIASTRIGAGANVVDVLLDESGGFVAGDVSVIAGILFEYDKPETAAAIARDLNAFNLTWGLSRDILRGGGPRVNEMKLPVLRKQMTAAQQQASLELMTTNVFQNSRIRAVGIVVPNPPTQGPGGAFVDVEYRQCLSSLLEVLIADVVDPTATVHIDVATRLRHVPDEAERQRQARNFGRRTAHGLTIFALAPEEVHPITDNIAWRRGVRAPTVARASTIDDRFLWELSDNAKSGSFFLLADRKTGRPAQQVSGAREESQRQLLDTNKKAHPRQVHYLADWVAGAARKVALAHAIEVPIIADWFSDGFLVTADATLDKMLLGLRSGSLSVPSQSPDRIAEAVQFCGEAIEAWRAAPGSFPVLHHLAARLGEIARAAAGAEVRRALRSRLMSQAGASASVTR